MAENGIIPTPITEASLKATLIQKIQASHVEIEDMSGGCGQAFSAIIVSEQFFQKSSLARHRLVNGVLREEIAAIHAWTARCYTREEWERVVRARGEEGAGESDVAVGLRE